MKKRLQGLIAGLLIGVLSANGVVFAKQLHQTAELFYNNIKISLNGQEIQPKDANGNYVEPFIINGTTYLPVRAVANALGVNVDWDGNTNTVLLSNQDAKNAATGFNASSVASQISVIKEHYWDDSHLIGGGYCIALVLKNNSTYTVSPRVQISFKDKDGKVVGSKDRSEYAFGPGNEIVFIFRNSEPFESYEYIISAEEEKYFDECVSNLECTYSMTDKKVIVQVKNNGNEKAQFVEYTVLFKKDGKVVRTGSGSCMDGDCEIKPGMTEMDECFAYTSFDSVEIYLTGRLSKNPFLR